MHHIYEKGILRNADYMHLFVVATKLDGEYGYLLVLGEDRTGGAKSMRRMSVLYYEWE